MNFQRAFSLNPLKWPMERAKMTRIFLNKATDSSESIKRREMRFKFSSLLVSLCSIRFYFFYRYKDLRSGNLSVKSKFTQKLCVGHDILLGSLSVTIQIKVIERILTSASVSRFKIKVMSFKCKFTIKIFLCRI